MKKNKTPHFEYFGTSLKNIVLAWSYTFMIKKDWEIMAIDESRDVVVFKRLENSSTKKRGKG